jgi:RNA polymerase sigma factor (TIGR02999 family)
MSLLQLPETAIAPIVEELRRLAHGVRRRLRPGETLGTTALVHEAFLKLSRSEHVGTLERAHFFALAARAMRDIVIDAARRRQVRARVHGEPEQAEDWLPADPLDVERLLAVDEALARLAEIHPRLADVVICRFFAGYTEEETAEILAVDVRTIQRDWAKARAYLGSWHG